MLQSIVFNGFDQGPVSKELYFLCVVGRPVSEHCFSCVLTKVVAQRFFVHGFAQDPNFKAVCFICFQHRSGSKALFSISFQQGPARLKSKGFHLF